MRCATLLLAVVLLAGTFDMRAHEPGCHTSTPFRLTMRRGVAVDVTLGGRGPYHLLLDTGSTHSAITARVAASLDASPIARAPVRSVTGTRMLPVVAVERLTLGPHTSSVMPSVIEEMPDAGEGVDGVVGQDILAALRYTIDFRDRRILWHGGGCPHDVTGPRARLGLEWRDGRFIVRAGRAGRELRLVPDSGSQHLVLYAADAGAGRPAGRLETIGGAREVRFAPVADLRLDGLVLRPMDALVLPRPETDPGDADGLLPLHLFGRATFDGPGRELVLMFF